MYSKFTEQVRENSSNFDFVAAHFACENLRFSPETPEGYVNFGSAQNYLNPNELQARLEGVAWDIEDAHYQPFAGTDRCKAAIADYLQSLSQTEVDHDHLIVGNGIISVLEALSIALLDPGETVIVPAPVFPGLVNALGLRTQARVAYLHLQHEQQFHLTPAEVEEAILREQAAGERVKAVLLCSPGNPVGQVFDADEIEAFVAIAKEHDCALIVDEVYASSCFAEVEFHSVVKHQAEHVYVLGGLSKDFGLAGFATGWLYGRNREVMNAVAKQSHFFRLPAPVQRVIESVLEPSWRDGFIAANRQMLTGQYLLTQSKLEELGIATSPAEAGLCMWLDLREYLERPTREAEMWLYQCLLRDQRLHVSPGMGFYCSEPGFFRICFSQPEATLREGLCRLGQALGVLSLDLSSRFLASS